MVAVNQRDFVLTETFMRTSYKPPQDHCFSFSYASDPLLHAMESFHSCLDTSDYKHSPLGNTRKQGELGGIDYRNYTEGHTEAVASVKNLKLFSEVCEGGTVSWGHLTKA